MKKNYFLKFSKIRNSRISQNSVWKPNFFAEQAIPKILFALHFHYTSDTPYRFWFVWTTSWPDGKDLFLKFLFREIQKFVWNSNFFPGQVIPEILFVLPYHYTGDILYQVWFDLDNSFTRWKRIVFRIRENS